MSKDKRYYYSTAKVAEDTEHFKKGDYVSVRVFSDKDPDNYLFGCSTTALFELIPESKLTNFVF